jgi:hypothetical protein
MYFAPNLRMIKGGGGRGWIMYHEQRKKEKHTEFWSQ